MIILMMIMQTLKIITSHDYIFFRGHDIMFLEEDTYDMIEIVLAVLHNVTSLFVLLSYLINNRPKLPSLPW